MLDSVLLIFHYLLNYMVYVSSSACWYSVCVNLHIQPLRIRFRREIGCILQVLSAERDVLMHPDHWLIFIQILACV